jgi:hypothetical protein
MIRFTIRDVLWLTVVVALAWWIEHRRFTAARLALYEQQTKMRFDELRAKELMGKVILPASPEVQFKTLERRGWERPRAKDE